MVCWPMRRLRVWYCTCAPSAGGVSRPPDPLIEAHERTKQPPMADCAFQRPRRARPVRALLRSLLWILCCALPVMGWAGRPVRVYEVDLKGGQTPAALQDAMRDALVRATGRRESANDPAFASLIASASMYVKAYASGPRGEAQVVFDSAAVERGLPISIVPLAVTDASGNELGRDAVMQVAQRYGGDAVLLGRGDPSVAGTPLQWTLYTNYA